MRRILISVLLLVPALLAVQGPAAQAAPSGVSLAGVHFYSGDISMVDQSIPAGQRGWNVEHVANVASCDGNAINAAATAQSHGLVNIIRMTYNHPLPVPVNAAEYESWKNSFKNCVNAFGSRASIYIVGNEPNIDCAPACPISAQKYADAFNYLYARKGEMRAGTELLAVFNSPFTPASWFYDMTRRLSGSDGFAVHTGGIRAGCSDPRQPCADWADSKYDGAFRFYRDMISQIDQRFWDKPVYITEFNTYAGGAAPPARRQLSAGLGE